MLRSQGFAKLISSANLGRFEKRFENYASRDLLTYVECKLTRALYQRIVITVSSFNI